MSDAVNNGKNTDRDESGKFTEGNSGRPKGAKNKLTNNIKELVMNALNDDRVGGQEAFIDWIVENKKNRMVFYGWLMKMLPSSLDVSGELSATLSVTRLKESLKEYDNGGGA